MTDLPKILNKCQIVFNFYVRERDTTDGYFKCISCGEIKDRSQLNAGHYYSQGHFSGLRFDEDNCHGQCIKCNKFLHGNLIEYRKNLLLKIGEERFNLLEIRAGAYKRSGHKFTRFDLLYKIAELRKKIKDLEL